MLMHYFEVFEFKFAFEFIGLVAFQKYKIFFPFSPSLLPILARFCFEISSQSPAVPLLHFRCSRSLPCSARSIFTAQPACAPSKGCIPAPFSGQAAR
jgi:hypothetical protein